MGLWYYGPLRAYLLQITYAETKHTGLHVAIKNSCLFCSRVPPVDIFVVTLFIVYLKEKKNWKVPQIWMIQLNELQSYT